MDRRDFRKRLIDLVDQFLAERLEFDAFAERYIKCFVEEVPDDYFSKEELSLFGDVHEKAEWTCADPPAEDRQYGWMSITEYADWLRVHRKSLPEEAQPVR